jgi:methylphosphotriester-DNA--protein-cysteine methyltransferase
MIDHTALGDNDFGRSRRLKALIDNKEIVFGGNKVLKIYGLLNCKSGKRIKFRNRVFFTSEAEAIAAGFRPCGHCMREKYQEWKRSSC